MTIVAAWCVVVLLVGAALAAGWLARRRVAAVARWPRAEGTVVTASVEHRRNGTYAPLVAYAYAVDGTQQASDRLRPGGIPFFYSEAKAAAALAPYHAGEPVTVYHDPRRPGRAALELVPLSHARRFWLTLAAAAAGVALLLTFT